MNTHLGTGVYSPVPKFVVCLGRAESSLYVEAILQSLHPTPITVVPLGLTINQIMLILKEPSMIFLFVKDATAGTSSGMQNAAANLDRQKGGEDGKLTGWSSVNPVCSRKTGLHLNSGSFSRQKKSCFNDSTSVLCFSGQVDLQSNLLSLVVVTL
ncbi:hypothetical protein ACH5RR_013377 [Cinchona calisaya]|uniref:Uncharacterized protein n=1 Tax=Cinchona calisaya TaxID=153742 RepID=A0ABD2ZZV1_9GENT